MVVALDIGTSSVRALAFDAQGKQVKGLGASVQHKPTVDDQGASELDAELLLDRCIQVLGAVVVQARDAGISLDAVAVSTFWHSIVGVDGSFRPVTPMYLWADTRSASQADQLRARLDERAVHGRTGCLFHPSYPAVRLLWLRQTQPELFENVRFWLSPGEYISLKLFGQPLCSHSMASGTGMFDIRRCDWDEEVLEAVGVRREQLGLLCDADESVRHAVPPYGKALGSLGSVHWFPALGDGACSNVGAGCTRENRIAAMVGTSGAMRVCVRPAEGEDFRWPWGVWCYRVNRRIPIMGGALSNGGNVVAWMRDLLAGCGDADIDALLEGREPDQHGLTFLPLLAGERSPGWSGRATGALVGLRQSTSAVDILQAGMEAVVNRFVLIYELLSAAAPEVEEVVATGGGLLRSAVWRQMLADALGRPVRPCLEEEASARGAALSALAGLGAIGDLGDLQPELGEAVEPDPDRFEAYKRARERQMGLYKAVIEADWASGMI